MSMKEAAEDNPIFQQNVELRVSLAAERKASEELRAKVEAFEKLAFDQNRLNAEIISDNGNLRAKLAGLEEDRRHWSRLNVDCERRLAEAEQKNKDFAGMWLIGKYSSDRHFFALEIHTGLKDRGYWVPKETASSDMIGAVFMALEKEKSRAEAAEKSLAEAEKKYQRLFGAVNGSAPRDLEYMAALEKESTRLTAALSSAQKQIEAARATIKTAANLLGPDRPMCPKDMPESQRYEFILETARELLTDLLASLASAGEPAGGWAAAGCTCLGFTGKHYANTCPFKSGEPATGKPCVKCGQGPSRHDLVCRLPPAPVESVKPKEAE